MESLTRADVFFVVTSVAVLIVTIGLVVVIVYVVSILRDVREIAQKMKRGFSLAAIAALFKKTRGKK